MKQYKALVDIHIDGHLYRKNSIHFLADQAVIESLLEVNAIVEVKAEPKRIKRVID